MKIKLKISRCDPIGKGQCESFLQAYDVEAREGMSILDALHVVKDELDGTLTFRRSCRSAICGSCAMSINGFPKLACKTQVTEEYKKYGVIVIKPLPNHSVIKDLVVDFNAFWDKMYKVEPWLSASSAISYQPSAFSKKDVLKINDSSKCIMCGCCNGVCNSLDIDRRFIGPAALAKAWRFVGDTREGEKKKRLERLSEVHGMWDCVRCVHCAQYCPKDVRPLQQIERLRGEAIKEGILDNHGAKHVESMVDSIKRVGRLDEAAMTFKTLGFLRSLGMKPLGLKMEMHGKMPIPLIFQQLEKMDEVQKIYEEVEKLRDKGVKE